MIEAPELLPATFHLPPLSFLHFSPQSGLAQGGSPNRSPDLHLCDLFRWNER